MFKLLILDNTKHNYKKFLEEVSRLYSLHPLPLNRHCCGVFFLQVNLVLFLENHDKNFDMFIKCDVIFNKSITNGIRMESDQYLYRKIGLGTIYR